MSEVNSTLELLQRYESRNVTFIEPDGSWPIVWERAQGMHVWDAAGRKYLDLTGAFGVAAAGHANRAVVRAGQKQMSQLLHAMGDVHPHAQKAELARALSELTFERWTHGAARGKTIYCNSGFEAVEAALKTAMLATGKPEVISFAGAYHGLGYGALNVTERNHFRGPFTSQLREFGRPLPYPTSAEELAALGQALKEAVHKGPVGAVLVEPIQARGGIRVPARGFLPALRDFCDKQKIPLILDEIYTGFGRTGAWFACEHEAVLPDLICLGKALTGGFPLSACVGRADLMDLAWPKSNGEAIHTSTFLGHPVGCAMALANLKEIERLKLAANASAIGAFLLGELQQLTSERFQLSARGRGLIVGLELRTPDGQPATDATLALMKALLGAGIIIIPEGADSNVLGFTPPLIISQAQARQAARALAKALKELP